MAAILQPMQYNDLTSLARSERASTSLTVVRKDLYSAMQDLYERQCQECERLALEDRDSLLFDGASEKKRKIYSTMRDLTIQRMTKIALLAIRGVMGANNVLDGLTPEEKEYYESIHEPSKRLLSLTDRKKKAATMDITNPGKMVEPEKDELDFTGTVVEKVSDTMDMTEPDVPESAPEPPPVVPVDDIEEFPEDEEEIEVPVEVQPLDVPEEAVEETASQPEVTGGTGTSDDMMVVRITEDLQPFSGLGDIVYKLRKEDIVRLPTMFAFALMNRGVAVAVDVRL